MVAENPKPDPATIAQRGRDIYNARLKMLLEPRHVGEYVVIEVIGGGFEVDRDHRGASDRAARRWPASPRYAMKVGSPTIGRVGHISSVERS